MRKQWDAVLFDFDGTLVDSAPDIIAALNRLLHSPIRTKMVRRTARQAMRFVATDV